MNKNGPRKLLKYQEIAIPRIASLGRSVPEIADLLDVSQQTIRACLEKRKEHPRLIGLQNYLYVYSGDEKKRVRVNKRPYHSVCELCSLLRETGNMLHYHHWDDNRPWLGIWVCSSCHHLAEAIDRGSFRVGRLADKYRVLKMKMTKELVS